MSVTTTAVWRALLGQLMEEGTPVSQVSAGAAFKGHTSYELLGFQSRVPMDRAVVLCTERTTPAYLRFLAAEAAWILSGSNRVDEIAPFARAIARFSDDGLFFDGAYGPPFVEQVGWVRRRLVEDPMTRQAVMTIWRQRPGSSLDVPCTVALQWLLRPESAAPDAALDLHCVATMRSSDAITGWSTDVHTFSMMSAYLAISLGRPDVRLGELVLTAGSQHLYQRDLDLAHRSVWLDETASELREGESMPLAPVRLTDFSRPTDLVDHLWRVANRDEAVRGGWLGETLP